MSKAKWRDLQEVKDAMDAARFVHFRGKCRPGSDRGPIAATAAVIRHPDGEFIVGLGQVNKGDGDSGSRKQGREVSLGRAGKTLASLLGFGILSSAKMLKTEEELVAYIAKLRKSYSRKR